MAMSSYDAIDVDYNVLKHNSEYNENKSPSRSYIVKRQRTNSYGNDEFNIQAYEFSQKLRAAINLVIPEVRKAVQRDFEIKPFTQYPRWVSLFQDALEESWRLIWRGGQQRPSDFMYDGGHVTILLLAAEIDNSFKLYDKFFGACSPLRVEYTRLLIHKVMSLPGPSGTKENIAPKLDNEKTRMEIDG